jgi:hypothetical protein
MRMHTSQRHHRAWRVVRAQTSIGTRCCCGRAVLRQRNARAAKQAKWEIMAERTAAVSEFASNRGASVHEHAGVRPPCWCSIQAFKINILEMVDQIFASWNPLTSWLRQIVGLQRAAHVRLAPLWRAKRSPVPTSLVAARPSRRRGDYSIDRYSTNG